MQISKVDKVWASISSDRGGADRCFSVVWPWDCPCGFCTTFYSDLNTENDDKPLDLIKLSSVLMEGSYVDFHMQEPKGCMRTCCQGGVHVLFHKLIYNIDTCVQYALQTF